MGDAYASGSGNYTEYDPESPRPNGLFPTETGQHRGFGDVGAPPPPPPPPTMNLPGKSIGFGATRIPGPPSDANPSGVAPPLWPPARMPVTSKPPLAVMPHPPAVNRRSSIQNEGWTNRASMDQPRYDGPAVDPMVDNSVGGYAGMHHERYTQTGTLEESPAMYGNNDTLVPDENPRPPLESDLHVTNSAVKKPPPAIAKESPLKAFYAKGAENYDGNRRRINLKMTLDSVATSAPRNDEGFQPMAPPYHPPMAHDSNDGGMSTDSHMMHAPEPPYFSLQHQGGSNQGSSQSFHGNDSEQRNVFQPMNPPAQAIEPQYQEPKEIGHGESRAEAMKRVQSRGRKGKKRFILSQILFFACLIFNPVWTLTRVAVTGALVQSGLAGWANIEKDEFNAMMHSQFHEDTTVYHGYMGVIEDTFDIVRSASETAWGTTVNKLECESSSSACHFARIIMHGCITTSLVAKNVVVAIYTSIPRAVPIGKAWIASIVRGEFWDKGDDKTIQSWIVKKSFDTRQNVFTLTGATKDFMMCAAKTSLKAQTMLNLSKNLIMCLTSSYDSFLKAPSASQDDDFTSSSVFEHAEMEDEEKQPLPSPLPDMEEELADFNTDINQSHIDISDAYNIDSYRDVVEYGVEKEENPDMTFETQKEEVERDTPVNDSAETLPIDNQDTFDESIEQEDGKVDEEMPIVEHEDVPPLYDVASHNEPDLEIPAEIPDEKVRTEDNVTDPEYLEEPESPDDALARARRRLEKEKVLADRKKRRETEKSHRSSQVENTEASNQDVRSMLLSQDTEARAIDSIVKETEDAFAKTKALLLSGISQASALIHANMAHIVTAIGSAMIVSLLFMIQGRRSIPLRHDEAAAGVQTPRSRGAKVHIDEEPATVYKSAEPLEKKTSRQRSSRTGPACDDDEKPKRGATTTQRRRRSSKAVEEEHPARRPTRTRSKSRTRQ